MKLKHWILILGGTALAVIIALGLAGYTIAAFSAALGG